MLETFEQFVARVNANGYILPPDPTAGVRVMAKQVKMKKGAEFTFAQTGGGGASKYPWDEWFNGDLLLIEADIMESAGDGAGLQLAPHGKRDYDVDTNAMPPKLKVAARRRYKVVQISRKDADGNRLKDSLIIKARDMTAEERLAEDLLRAEEKAARKGADQNGDDTVPTAQPVDDQNAA